MSAPIHQSGRQINPLMLLVAGIGILAAIMIPAYQDYALRSKTADFIHRHAADRQRSITDQLSRYRATHGDQGLPTWEGLEQHKDFGPGFRIVFADLDPRLDGKTVYFSPRISPDGLQWDCFPEGLADSDARRLLPRNCRGDLPEVGILGKVIGFTVLGALALAVLLGLVFLIRTLIAALFQRGDDQAGAYIPRPTPPSPTAADKQAGHHQMLLEREALTAEALGAGAESPWRNPQGMNVVELTRLEDHLMDLARKVDGYMEDKHEILKETGVYAQYGLVHQAYTRLAEEGSLEALKRALFIQWYALAEPSCFTGIFELEHDSQQQVLELLEQRARADTLDDELRWMLPHYYAITDYYMDVPHYDSVTDCDTDGFESYYEVLKKHSLREDTQYWARDVTPDPGLLEGRGQMGDYWSGILEGHIEQLQYEHQQTREYLLSTFSEHGRPRPERVQRLFDTRAGCCPEFGMGEKDHKPYCKLVRANRASVRCQKHWVRHDRLLRGIIRVCDSPVTPESKKSAESVLKLLIQKGLVTEKVCRTGMLRLSGPGKLRHWYFNMDRPG